MTAQVKKVFSVLLAIAMIFSLAVVGFAADESFKLKSGEAVAASGNFKKKYVKELKVTVKASGAIEITDDFSLTVTGTDGVKKTYSASDVSVKYGNNNASLTVSYERNMNHEDEYTFTVAAGSFKDTSGKLSNELSFTTDGNLILEKLNVDRPSTPMQKFIKWLSSWEYAKYIQPIIDLLKWFDSL